MQTAASAYQRCTFNVRKILEQCVKMLQIYLIFWRGNFVKRHSFHIVLGDSPENMRTLWVSIKFPHKELKMKLRYFTKWKALR